MRARRLKHKITIEQSTNSKNILGESVSLWSDFKIVWASVEEIKNEEKFISNHAQEIGTRKFRIRYTTGIDLDMRIKYNSKSYEIIEIVNPYESNKELLIAVKEIK